MNQTLNIDFSFLHLLLPIAMEAGEAILDIYDTDFNVSQKNDRSPLTLADRRSNEVITSGLSAPPFDRIPILSEEGSDIPYQIRKDWEHFWLVDPLDGTKEFIRKNGEFTVNIALISGDRPVVGIIYVPARDTLYFAGEKCGAYRLITREIMNQDISKEDLIRASDRLPLRGHRTPETSQTSATTIVASRSHLSPETEAFIHEMRTRYKDVQTISAGSSLKFCLVAEGTADIYPRFGPTMEWDTAAAHCIVEESGGKVVSAKTHEPLKYNKESLLNPWFIATNARHAPVLLHTEVTTKTDSFQ